MWTQAQYDLTIYEEKDSYRAEILINSIPFTIHIPKENNPDMPKIIKAYTMLQSGYYYVGRKINQNKEQTNGALP